MSSLRRRAPACLLVLCLLPSASAAAPIQNVILMIADGMGPAHVEAARLTNGGSLSFESAPHHATMTTDSIHPTLGNPTVTDSAASATAMATGEKVANLVVSFRFPGDGSDLPTSLEFWQDRGKSTGLVTTSYVEDATPAAFGSHVPARLFTGDIASDLLTESRPNLLLGGVELAGGGVTPAGASAAGYTVVETRDALLGLDLATETHISGQFGGHGPGFEYDHLVLGAGNYDDVPFLSEMSVLALDFLDRDPDGFFLMIEQENTDIAGHLGGQGTDRIGRNVFGTLEFAETVQLVLDWIGERDDPTDTLLVVTADHETGGLDVLADNGPGELPTVSWASSDHTRVPVDVWAWGRGASRVSGLLDNTDIFGITTRVPEPGTSALVVLAVGGLVLRRRGAGARRVA